MEKAVFPLKYIHVVEKLKGSDATLFGGRGCRENVYAPFTGIIRKVYKISGNFVWLESKDKVLWADGTVDYMTILTGHDDNVESLYVGKEIKQGEVYYTQGHCGPYGCMDVYIEVGRGRFTGTGWHPNPDGKWVINNSVLITDALYVSENTIVIKNDNYMWKYLKEIPMKKNGGYLGSEKVPLDLIEYDKEETIIFEKAEEYKEGMLIKPSISMDDYRTHTETNPSYDRKIFTCEAEDLYYLKLYPGEELYIRNVKHI